LAKDTLSGLYEPIGSMPNETTVDKHSFELSPGHTDGVTVMLRFLHQGGNGNASHVFRVDKAQVNTITAADFGFTLSDAAQQDLAQARYQTTGTVWYVDLAGNDGNSGLSPNTAKLSPKTTAEAASATDVVLLGPGTFALGANTLEVPDNVSLYGSGMDMTVITSTVNLSVGGAIVKPGSFGTVADMTIEGTLTDGTSQAAFGKFLSGQSRITNAIGRNLRLKADTDGVYVFDDVGPSLLRLEDSVIEVKFDGIINFGSESVIEVVNTSIVVTGPSSKGSGVSRGVNSAGGAIIRLYNCDIRVSDGGAVETLAYFTNLASTIEAYGGSVFTSGSEGDIFDADNTGTLLLLSGVDYDAAKTSGTITAVHSGIDWASVKNPTATVGLSSTTIDTVTTNTDLDDIKGTGFVKDTDSMVNLAHIGADSDTLETLSDQIDGIVGSTGTGARTIAVTVNDGAAVLENATVRFTEGANTYAGPTDASGEISFSLDDATYAVA
ncbi:hypothetical protein LCGC14_2514660, partial [marine sediment metagenome]